MENATMENATVVSTVQVMFCPFEQMGKFIKANPANRVLDNDAAHIERLAKRIKEKGFSKNKPIVVRSDGVISAGHRRYIAAQKAQSGVYYTINDDPNLLFNDAEEEKFNKKWTTEDWIRRYAAEGKIFYRMFQLLMECYPIIPLKLLQAIVLGKRSEQTQKIFDIFANGKFEYGTSTDEVERIIRQLSDIWGMLRQTHTNLDVKVSLQFGLALLVLFKNEKYDHKEFLKKLMSNVQRCMPQGKRSDNLRLLEGIYNSGKQDKNRICLVDVKTHKGLNG
jgi:hypothetical protein